MERLQSIKNSIILKMTRNHEKFKLKHGLCPKALFKFISIGIDNIDLKIGVQESKKELNYLLHK
jgi:hypothetical protein